MRLLIIKSCCMYNSEDNGDLLLFMIFQESSKNHVNQTVSSQYSNDIFGSFQTVNPIHSQCSIESWKDDGGHEISML
jgi:hypothetical protein